MEFILLLLRFVDRGKKLKMEKEIKLDELKKLVTEVVESRNRMAHLKMVKEIKTKKYLSTNLDSAGSEIKEKEIKSLSDKIREHYPNDISQLDVKEFIGLLKKEIINKIFGQELDYEEAIKGINKLAGPDLI